MLDTILKCWAATKLEAGEHHISQLSQLCHEYANMLTGYQCVNWIQKMLLKMLSSYKNVNLRP